MKFDDGFSRVCCGRPRAVPLAASRVL